MFKMGSICSMHRLGGQGLGSKQPPLHLKQEKKTVSSPEAGDNDRPWQGPAAALQVPWTNLVLSSVLAGATTTIASF